MKWITIIIALLGWAVSGHAESRSIHVEWGYTPPSEPVVTGYRLYQEAVAVHWWEGASTEAGDCVVDITQPLTVFTMTATFADGTESTHSAPYAFYAGQAGNLKFVWLKPGNAPVLIIKPGGVRLR